MMQMSLYLIKDDVHGYDVYDSWVVAARSRKQALSINPGHINRDLLEIPKNLRPWTVTAQCIFLGKASVSLRQPIILCASFNAG